MTLPSTITVFAPPKRLRHLAGDGPRKRSWPATRMRWPTSAPRLEQLEGVRAGTTLAQLAAHTDEFQGDGARVAGTCSIPTSTSTSCGTGSRTSLQATQQTMMDPPDLLRRTCKRLSWTQDYYDQMLKALDAGIDPLAESSEQVAFLFTKTDGQGPGRCVPRAPGTGPHDDALRSGVSSEAPRKWGLDALHSARA